MMHIPTVSGVFPSPLMASTIRSSTALLVETSLTAVTTDSSTPCGGDKSMHA